jgi:hypothetical protein
VDEDVLAIILGNEAVALLRIEPLDVTLLHVLSPLGLTSGTSEGKAVSGVAWWFALISLAFRDKSRVS